MAGFDPEQYLKRAGGIVPQPTQGFDPDAYLERTPAVMQVKEPFDPNAYLSASEAPPPTSVLPAGPSSNEAFDADSYLERTERESPTPQPPRLSPALQPRPGQKVLFRKPPTPEQQPQEAPRASLGEIAGAVGGGISSAFGNVFPEAFARALRGQGPEHGRPDSWTERTISKNTAEIEAAQLPADMARKRVLPGFTLGGIHRGLEQIGYSAAIRTAGLVAGTAAGAMMPDPTPASEAIGAMVGAAMLSGPMMFRTTKDRFLDDMYERLIAEDPGMTKEKWEETREALQSDANWMGLYEAVPEAVGAALTAGLIKLPLGKVIQGLPFIKKGIANAMTSKLASAGVKVGVDMGAELVFEGYTELKQSEIEAGRGLRPEARGSLGEAIGAVREEVMVMSAAALAFGGGVNASVNTARRMAANRIATADYAIEQATAQYGKESVQRHDADTIDVTIGPNQRIRIHFGTSADMVTGNEEAFLKSIASRGQRGRDTYEHFMRRNGMDPVKAAQDLAKYATVKGFTNVNPVIETQDGDMVPLIAAVQLVAGTATRGTYRHEMLHGLIKAAGGLTDKAATDFQKVFGDEEELAFALERMTDSPVIARISQWLHGAVGLFGTQGETVQQTAARIETSLQEALQARWGDAETTQEALPVAEAQTPAPDVQAPPMPVTTPVQPPNPYLPPERQIAEDVEPEAAIEPEPEPAPVQEPEIVEEAQPAPLPAEEAAPEIVPPVPEVPDAEAAKAEGATGPADTAPKQAAEVRGAAEAEEVAPPKPKRKRKPKRKGKPKPKGPLPKLDVGDRMAPSRIRKLRFKAAKDAAKQAKYPDGGGTAWDRRKGNKLTDMRRALMDHRRWYMNAEGRSERKPMSAEAKQNQRKAMQNRKAKTEYAAWEQAEKDLAAIGDERLEEIRAQGLVLPSGTAVGVAGRLSPYVVDDAIPPQPNMSGRFAEDTVEELANALQYVVADPATGEVDILERSKLEVIGAEEGTGAQDEYAYEADGGIAEEVPGRGGVAAGEDRGEAVGGREPFALERQSKEDVEAELDRKALVARQAKMRDMASAPIVGRSVDTTGDLLDRSKAAAPLFAPPTPEGGIRFSAVTPEQDREYMAAVTRGDTNAAQSMVDEAAKGAGYNVGPVWHGGMPNFNQFELRQPIHGRSQGDGIYFTERKSKAEHFGFPRRFYLSIHSDADGLAYDMDNIVMFSTSQIKSADAITRDDAGNVVPLSERFDPTNPDIRYSAEAADDAIAEANAIADTGTVREASVGKAVPKLLRIIYGSILFGEAGYRHKGLRAEAVRARHDVATTHLRAQDIVTKVMKDADLKTRAGDSAVSFDMDDPKSQTLDARQTTMRGVLDDLRGQALKMQIKEGVLKEGWPASAIIALETEQAKLRAKGNSTEAQKLAAEIQTLKDVSAVLDANKTPEEKKALTNLIRRRETALKNKTNAAAIAKMDEEIAALQGREYMPMFLVAQGFKSRKYHSMGVRERGQFGVKLKTFHHQRAGRKTLQEYYEFLNSEGMLTEDDVNPVKLTMEMYSDAMHRVAVKRLMDYAEDEGLVLPANAAVDTPGDWKASDKIGVHVRGLQGKKVHQLLATTLRELSDIDRVGRTWFDKLLAITKIGQFIVPSIVWSYDVLQLHIRGLGEYNPIKSFGQWRRAIAITRKRGPVWQDMQRHGLFQSPNMPTKASHDESIDLAVRQLRDDVPALAKAYERTVQQRFYTPAEWAKNVKEHPNPGGRLVNGLTLYYRGMAGLTWKGDELIRTLSYMRFMDQNKQPAKTPDGKKEMTDDMWKETAARYVSNAHGAYATMSTKYQQFMSRIVFVHTFRALMPWEVGKSMYTLPMMATKAILGKQDFSPYQWKLARKAMTATVLLPMAVYHMMKANGYEPDEEGMPEWLKKMSKVPIGLPFPTWKNHWKYKKTITNPDTGQRKEIVIGVNDIVNMLPKWFNRATKEKPERLDDMFYHLANVFKWELNPMYRIVLDAVTNETSMGGARPRRPGDSQAKQMKDTSAYVFGNMLRIYHTIVRGGETNAGRREVRADLDAAMNMWEKVMLGYYAGYVPFGNFVPGNIGYSYSRRDRRARLGYALRNLDQEIAHEKNRLKHDFKDKPDEMREHLIAIGRQHAKRRVRLRDIFLGNGITTGTGTGDNE